MRRADRLFRLVQRLRRTKLTTAARLAGELEVSERTVYRDVRDLIFSGVPIRGEAGVGYALGPGFDLPPLMFTQDEIEALVFGARIVQSHGDVELARAAATALEKVESVLPERLRGKIAATALLAPGARVTRAPHLRALRAAIRERRKVRIDYIDLGGKKSRRVVRPLAVAFWGKTWTLAAWCEKRTDFRGFRLDAIAAVEPLDVRFTDEKGRTLDAFVEHAAKNALSRKP